MGVGCYCACSKVSGIYPGDGFGQLYWVGFFVTARRARFLQVCCTGICNAPGTMQCVSIGRRKFVYTLLAVAAALVATGAPTSLRAEPLPDERCQALRDELPLLEGGGAGENFRKGPEWGKANLSPKQLSYVRRLMTVRENLFFRCRTFDVVRNPPPRSYAPGAAPLPERRPPPPPGAIIAKASADVVPSPVRPDRDISQGVGGNEGGLRGTISARPSAPGAVPPPVRKAVPDGR